MELQPKGTLLRLVAVSALHSIRLTETLQLMKMGCGQRLAQFRKEAEKKDANVVILNTCSIRDHAEQKVYSYLGPHANRKRKGEPVAIVVADWKP